MDKAKKQMIREYKETIQPMGIYQIKNLKSGKIFIGSSKHVHGIINRIKFQLKLGSYSNKEIQKAYNESGENGFTIDVLDYLSPKEDSDCDYEEELKLLEEMWLDNIQPYNDKGYNKSRKALD